MLATKELGFPHYGQLDVRGNLRAMISHSREWAKSRNLLAKSEVHGADEWKIPTKKEFAWKLLTGQKTSQSATFEVEDWTCSDHISWIRCFFFAWPSGQGRVAVEEWPCGQGEAHPDACLLQLLRAQRLGQSARAKDWWWASANYVVRSGLWWR